MDSSKIKEALNFRNEQNYGNKVAKGVLKTDEIYETVLIVSTIDMERRITSIADEANENGLTKRIRFKNNWFSLCNAGIGASSYEVFLTALYYAGAKKIIRVEYCASLNAKIKIGDLFIPTEAIINDAVSRKYTRDDRIVNLSQLELVRNNSEREKALVNIYKGKICSVDTFFLQDKKELQMLAEKIDAMDMETVFLYVFCHERKIEANALLLVSDLPCENIDSFSNDKKIIKRMYQGMDQLQNEVRKVLSC